MLEAENQTEEQKIKIDLTWVKDLMVKQFRAILIFLAFVVLCVTLLFYFGKISHFKAPGTDVQGKPSAEEIKHNKSNIENRVNSYNSYSDIFKNLLADNQISDNVKLQISQLKDSVFALRDSAERLAALLRHIDEKPSLEQRQIMTNVYRFLSFNENPNVTIDYGSKAQVILEQSVLTRVQFEKDSMVKIRGLDDQEKRRILGQLGEMQAKYTGVVAQLKNVGAVRDSMAEALNGKDASLAEKDITIERLNGDISQMRGQNTLLADSIVRSKKPQAFEINILLDGVPTKKDDCYKLPYVTKMRLDFKIRYNDRAYNKNIDRVEVQWFYLSQGESAQKGALLKATVKENMNISEEVHSVLTIADLKARGIKNWEVGIYAVDIYINGVFQERKNVCVERMI